jgi:hypothetical protein
MFLNDVRAQVLAMLAEGEGPSAIAKEVGIARTSVYRIKKEAAEGKVKHHTKGDPPQPGKDPNEVVDVHVVKVVPNPRLFLGLVGDRFIRVVKKPNQMVRPKSVVKGQWVKDDVYRLV